MKYLHEYDIRIDLNRVYLEKATIRHLLTLTLGHDKMMLGSQNIAELKNTDLVSYVLNTPILYEPGECFTYTSSAAYLMSVIIQKVTDMKLLDFANKYLFEPLEISGVTWRESLQGYNLGCTGITIRNPDLNKIGRLFLNDGKYNGKAIVSDSWIQKMKTVQVLTPLMFDPLSAIPKYGYGFNLWICDNGNYFCDGTDGQYIIMVPSKKFVISTIGHQVDMRPITECLRKLL